jgi:hypothetical protein
MREKNHLHLVQAFLEQEKYLKLQQSLSIGLSQFALILESKSKESMEGIKLYLIVTMQHNPEYKDIVAMCRQMIAMVEEKISKLQ